MGLREEREGRPTSAEVEAASISTAIEDIISVATATDAVRCTRCGHTLTAQRSVELELGPVCRREVAA